MVGALACLRRTYESPSPVRRPRRGGRSPPSVAHPLSRVIPKDHPAPSELLRKQGFYLSSFHIELFEQAVGGLRLRRGLVIRRSFFVLRLLRLRHAERRERIPTHEDAQRENPQPQPPPSGEQKNKNNRRDTPEVTLGLSLRPLMAELTPVFLGDLA